MAFITAIEALVAAMIALRNAGTAAAIATAFATGGGSVAVAGAAIAAAGATYGLNQIAPSSNTIDVPTLSTSSNARESRVTNNITVQALDSESAARAVSKVLTQASARSIPALSGTSVRGN